jgi:hypothetical protein
MKTTRHIAASAVASAAVYKITRSPQMAVVNCFGILTDDRIKRCFEQAARSRTPGCGTSSRHLSRHTRNVLT